MTTASLLALAVAYLLGAIPTAVWIGKFFYNVDVREFGSGNAGATNTFRVLGKRAGIPVLAFDILKGALAVMLVWFATEAPQHSEDFVNMQIALGVASVIGHIFPIFAGFRGGKGVATLFGVVLAIHPVACLLSVGVFLLVFLAFRYVSLGSISAGFSYPIIVITLFRNDVVPSLIVFSVLVAVLLLITHQKNIERLLRRQESKIDLFKKKSESNDLQVQ